jgi:hypothetical protein
MARCIAKAGATAPYFFLSYARDDSDVYLDKFVDDLSTQLSRRTAVSPVGICFRDTTAIELGQIWTEELKEALRTARVFVPLYSPTYFTRDYCGKEWQAFRNRLIEHASNTHEAIENLPLILPILWFPITMARFELPKSITQLQYAHGGLNAEYLQEGLQYLISSSFQVLLY